MKASAVRFLAASYLRGRGISWAAGPEPIFPDAATDPRRYSIGVDIVRTPPARCGHQSLSVVDDELAVLGNDAFDHVFVGPRFAEMGDRQHALLTTLIDKLKVGGHLVIYLLGPQWNDDVVRALLPGHWRAKDSRIFDGHQYCAVFKLLGRNLKKVEPPRPRAAKRACIARYGAIGDMVMLSPLIRRLAEDGYEVTLNVTPYCAEIARGNPHVSNVVIQEREVIPNADLGDYWSFWQDEYDRYINLSESIEGKLLKVEGRRDFYTSKAWREETCGTVNYVDQTMRLGGYPEVKGARMEQYFTREEQRQALHSRRRAGLDQFFVVWGLKGSSHHKQYPLLEPTLRNWLSRHPDATVVTVGGPVDQQYEFDHPQVVRTAGRISLRAAFALTQVADLVVGPESALINTAACFDVPKIVLLSHSTEHNLCAYWTNYTALKPEGVSCYPCAQLHYNLESCPLVQIEDVQNKRAWKGPACAGNGVSPERLMAALDQRYDAWKAKHAPEMHIANPVLVAA